MSRFIFKLTVVEQHVHDQGATAIFRPLLEPETSPEDRRIQSFFPFGALRLEMSNQVPVEQFQEGATFYLILEPAPVLRPVGAPSTPPQG